MLSLGQAWLLGIVVLVQHGGSQKSKSSNFAALSDLEWVVYFCRCVLGLIAYGIYTIIQARYRWLINV
ncbi:MAG: hypothetical protein V7L25_08480 [Nostoc sp.]|uniref:hypothetical protein n=1 Tax=Nostoc sp. TaxID=1180 RepID=UPI002FF0B3E0